MTTWHENLPKVELHVHLEGAIPHEALFTLITKYGGDPGIPDPQALARRFEYRDFRQFIETWSWKNRYLREYEDFSLIAELAARDMAKQNIRYAEFFYSPSLFVPKGLEVQEVTRSVAAGLVRVPEIEIALIADLVRDYGPQREMETLEKLKEVRDLGVIGIGIGGTEHDFPPAPFAPLFREARRSGFRTTAHAGEASGARSVRDAVELLGADRIGHGTRAGEDPELLRRISSQRIPLELCPLSNVRTGVVASMADHPIRDYFDRGLLISVNTDDPKMFNTSLSVEYRLLEQECGFTKQEICSLLLLGVESSWLPRDRKESLAASFREDPSWAE